MRKYSFLILIIILLFNNCNSDNHKITNIELRIREMRQDNPIQIQNIFLNIYSNNLTYLYNKPMIKIDNIWSIDLPLLPLNEELIFKAYAFNKNGNFIYQANKITILTNNSKNINLNLEYIDECNCSFFGANIVDIKNYKEYITITFNIYNYLKNELDYTIESEDNYIFTPKNGIINSYDNNHTYTLDINYTKPQDKRRYVNFLYLDDNNLDKKYKLEFDFIIDESGLIKIIKNLPPQILNLDINKSYNTVKIYANVIDDENSTIDYLWEVISGDLEIIGSNKEKQVLLNNYQMGIESQIAIQVKDKRGFMTREIYSID